MGVSLKMTVRAVVMVCCSLISALCAQDYDDRIPTLEEFAANFECPEKNGLFPDPDQCDLYYECIASVPEAIFCAPGLIFDFHDPDVCDKFYRCDKGRSFEYSCGPGLIFDVKIGSCTFESQASNQAKVCVTDEVKTIDGWSCPEETLTAVSHSTHANPFDCRSYFVCYPGGDPNKFGCQITQVFDGTDLKCKAPEEHPDPRCQCHYECEECINNDIEDPSQPICDYNDCTCKL